MSWRRLRLLLVLLVLGMATLSCAPSRVDPASMQRATLTIESDEGAQGTAESMTVPGAEATLSPEKTAAAAATEGEVSGVVAFPEAGRYRWAQIVDGLREPVDLQSAGDARLFVVEQRGLVWVWADGGLLEDPFLDMRRRVVDGGSEQGLLGLAFSPDYAQSGLLYVNYTGGGGDTVVARYRVSGDPNRADEATEEVLLRIEQPYRNHNGGGLAFGPDGYLYIGTGDGGSGGDPQGNGQNPGTLLGKILRLDVSTDRAYGIPSDNPFVSGGGLPEIWAYGLRNPWRYAFDGLTGDLYIGDVGQNKWEEIDFVASGVQGGMNFGWNLREGLHPFSQGEAEGLIDPVAEYGRDLGCSVTGGVVVRDPALPRWNGIYIYGDYCTGRIWGMVRNEDGVWQDTVLFDTEFAISSFGQGADGGVYVVDYGGAIYRLQARP